MKRIFIGLVAVVTTFFVGVLIQGSFQFQANFTDKLNSEVVVKSVENMPDLVSSDEKLTIKSERKEFSYPNPIYRFPRTGIYFSTIKYKDEQSEFQMELTYEKNYKTRRLRGVNQEYEILKIDGSVFDQKRDFKNISIKITKDKIILKTSKVKGIEYKFEGTFTKDEYFESDFDDQIVLKGILQKFSGGKKISEEEIEFTYQVGC